RSSSAMSLSAPTMARRVSAATRAPSAELASQARRARSQASNASATRTSAAPDATRSRQLHRARGFSGFTPDDSRGLSWGRRSPTSPVQLVGLGLFGGDGAPSGSGMTKGDFGGGFATTSLMSARLRSETEVPDRGGRAAR